MFSDTTLLEQHFCQFERALAQVENRLLEPMLPAQFAQMVRWQQALKLAVSHILDQEIANNINDKGRLNYEFRYHQPGARQDNGSQGYRADSLLDRNGSGQAGRFDEISKDGQRVVNGDGAAKCDDQISTRCAAGHYSKDVVQGLANLALLFGGQARLKDAETLLAPILENHGDDSELSPVDSEQRRYQRKVATIIQAMCLCEVNDTHQALAVLKKEGGPENQVLIAMIHLLEGERYLAGEVLGRTILPMADALIPVSEQLIKELNHG